MYVCVYVCVCVHCVHVYVGGWLVDDVFVYMSKTCLLRVEGEHYVQGIGVYMGKSVVKNLLQPINLYM